MSPTEYRIGCDIGGSFTDFILYDASTGAVVTLKVATTPDAPEQGLTAGIDHLARQHAALPTSLKTLIHGTTLVINAILERKGARTALLTTAGFRDVIETRREIRYDIYDIRQIFPTPVIPRNLRIGVAGRIASDGTEIQPPDPCEVKTVLRRLADDGIESVAVCFINSYANPDHERQIAAIAEQAAPFLSLSLSSEVLPEVREFERFSTTALNAYVKQKVDRYLAGVEDALASRGFSVPLYLMQSGGGIVTALTARHSPVRLAESGPVGGVLATRDLARLAGYPDALAFDMGGTTAKACLIRKGEMPVTSHYEVDRVHRFKRGSGTPLAVPTVDLIEIGAGGGSIARIDDLGRLRVGPDSAAADPGPACFGRGGVLPTVTDANLLLGYLDPADFVASGIVLDPNAAYTAVQRSIADPLGIPVLQAAAAIIEIVNESMSQAARIYSAENAGDLSASVMVAFGGGGPLHAVDVARKLKMPRVIVPEAAGVFSALGFLMAAPRYETSRSYPRRLDQITDDMLTGIFDELRLQAEAVVAGAAPGAPQSHSLLADLRYVGQGHQLRVRIEQSERRIIADAFRRDYFDIYGYCCDDINIEIVTLRVEACADLPGPAFRPLSHSDEPAEGERLAWDDAAGAMIPHRTLEFAAIRAPLEGPALVSQRGAVVRIARGCRALRHDRGWLEITMEAGPS
ncbi:hydantoinase/oxoprolinase family protein [Acetobacter musti]|uniref:Hydantoinase/oxoprolinase family protein n=1 Tax=Acetobacter musti TaxID=864732 RepID=A0ABX0JLB5_9PROT|nr:hydantoinase/oxoprolinase family protein [Acetobacter musti]NHN84146.1 hydantoinase/oxoprolinase family protein [Acetobacter musti]